MDRRRVVITGVGVVSSVGIGKDEFWKNITAGRSGISEVTVFDTSSFDTHNGGEVKGFDPSRFLRADSAERMGRASQFAVAAAKMALADAGLREESLRRSRTGVVVGTTMAETQKLEEMDRVWLEAGGDKVSPHLIPQYPGNSLSACIGYEFGTMNTVLAIPTACSAGNYTIGYAYDLIRTGRADLVFAGGSDAFSKVAFTGFNRLFAVAPLRCQPFDKNRKGMMVGEGAGILALESLDSATARKAPVYAEVLGYALSCDAHHMTAPSADGIAKVMEKALANAGIEAQEVDYVSAHGTGTPANDKAECEALKRIFGGAGKGVCTSSIKSMLGHTMGAASAIEAIACCLSITRSTIPPTINYETPDPECDVDCVPNSSRAKDVRVALNNSLAFGGNNACLALKGA